PAPAGQVAAPKPANRGTISHQGTPYVGEAPPVREAPPPPRNGGPAVPEGGMVPQGGSEASNPGAGADTQQIGDQKEPALNQHQIAKDQTPKAKEEKTQGGSAGGNPSGTSSSDSTNSSNQNRRTATLGRDISFRKNRKMTIPHRILRRGERRRPQARLLSL
ncbi:MAG: hypothetical protein L6R38_007078, partial [Xanthoria sp. 2 TBL-2021]